MTLFSKQLEIILEQGIQINDLTALDIFPFWADSDPRLSRFEEDCKSLTVPELLEKLDTSDSIHFRILLSIMLEGLSTFQEYQELSRDIDISDITELAKFDTEFRRYINRKNTVSYEDDFEEAPEEVFEEIEDNTFSRGVDVSIKSLSKCRKPEIRDESSFCSRADLTTSEDLFFPSNEFQILRYLGKGGEGKVYLAQDHLFQGQVALKQYECSLEESTSLREILIKEVKMMKDLSHPNIIKYFGLFTPDDSFEGLVVYNVVMEFVQGGSLADKLKSSGALGLPEIKNVTRDVLKALEFLHSKNIIHRDLKPSNVLGSDIFKLSDFGICTQVKELESIPRSFVGTAWYMAPEVIMQEPYSFAADIWSLGCLVYELYTGCKPFKTANIAKAMHLMVDCESPLQDKQLDTPVLEDFLMKCWRRPYSFRPSAKELLLHAFLND
jgi:tRNA A-37 threonylcarbamoyl transferase component Bud32